jgi:hypothetical protein
LKKISKIFPSHNFEKDPLQLRFSPEGKDWIIATETTLGAGKHFKRFIKMMEPELLLPLLLF